MKIVIEMDTATAGHLGALIAAMMQYGRIGPDQLADVVAPWAMPARVATTDEHYEKWYGEAMAASNEAGFVGISAAETIKLLHAHLIEARRAPIANGTLYADIPTPGLHGLIADLNAELYSRRVIKPEDNPASGVAAAALNCDAGGLMHTGEPMTTFNAADQGMTGDAARAMDETLNFASIFNAANADTEVVTLKVDNATAAQLDKNGLPWDSRIHAASKAINTDGTWRTRRGVDRELVATVEAELRQVMSVPVPADTHGSPELDADAAKIEALAGPGAAGPTLGDIWRNPEQQAAATLVIPPPPPPVIVEARAAGSPPEWVGQVTPPASPAPAGDPTNFPELVTFIAAQKVAGKLTQEQVAAALKEIGIEGALPVIAARLDIIPALVAKLRAIGGV